ncbi:unnamed protein product [Durusdinium trenchii]|uniref:Uncharacterized protein n=1 Tax=Durusdinium trenchii TaxID=1381693 RepID=A0ABP0SCK7_9DINO
MINDLIASAASFTDLQKKDSEKTKELQLLITELDGLRVENPRLKAENNVLHLEIMEAVESTETWEASVRSKLQSLEDEIESTKMNLQQESRTNFQKEQELHHLQAEATALLQLDELDATTKPCDALPQRSTFQPDAEPLMEKEESLTNALYQCRRSLLEVESKVAAFVARSKDLEEQGNKLCTQLFEGSKPSQPLRLRAVKAQLEAESSRKRRGVEELQEHRRELHERREASQEKERRFEERTQELCREEEALMADEAKEATKTTELLEKHRTEALVHEHHSAELQERTMALRKACGTLNSSSQILVGRLRQLSQHEVLRSTEQLRRVEELFDQLVVVQSGPGTPSALQQQRLEDQLQGAQEECLSLSSSRAALQEEVEAATLEAQTQTRHLEIQRKSMEGDIQSGAEIQTRWQSAGAHLQWLNSSLFGLTDEQRMLKHNLQEQQVSLHEEGLQWIQTQVKVQRLQAVVKSLDHTREEWVADLSRAVTSLRNAHSALTTTLQQEESAQVASDQLRLELLSSERSLHVATQQRQELATEVDDWSLELRGDNKRRDEARCAAAQLMDELREVSMHAWNPHAQRCTREACGAAA